MKIRSKDKYQKIWKTHKIGKKRSTYKHAAKNCAVVKEIITIQKKPSVFYQYNVKKKP